MVKITEEEYLKLLLSYHSYDFLDNPRKTKEMIMKRIEEVKCESEVQTKDNG